MTFLRNKDAWRFNLTHHVQPTSGRGRVSYHVETLVRWPDHRDDSDQLHLPGLVRPHLGIQPAGLFYVENIVCWAPTTALPACLLFPLKIFVVTVLVSIINMDGRGGGGFLKPDGGERASNYGRPRTQRIAESLEAFLTKSQMNKTLPLGLKKKLIAFKPSEHLHPTNQSGGENGQNISLKNMSILASG